MFDSRAVGFRADKPNRPIHVDVRVKRKSAIKVWNIGMRNMKEDAGCSITMWTSGRTAARIRMKQTWVSISDHFSCEWKVASQCFTMLHTSQRTCKSVSTNMLYKSKPSECWLWDIERAWKGISNLHKLPRSPKSKCFKNTVLRTMAFAIRTQNLDTSPSGRNQLRWWHELDSHINKLHGGPKSTKAPGTSLHRASITNQSSNYFNKHHQPSPTLIPLKTSATDTNATPPDEAQKHHESRFAQDIMPSILKNIEGGTPKGVPLPHLPEEGKTSTA